MASAIRSPWAIKKLSKKTKGNIHLSERLKWEAEVLRKLKHPNIVGFRAHLKSKTGDILAMEECSACLGNLIEERREEGDLTPFPKNIIFKVGSDISKALNYLHNTALILHCDIKSYNVLINNNFEACKLCDFGSCLPLTKNGTVDEEKAGTDYEYVGTNMWMAPEVSEFPQIVSVKADIFSFGLVLQEMMTLTIPVTENMVDSLEMSFEDDLLSDSLEIPDIDEEIYHNLIGVINMCTSNDPKERPNSEDLEDIFESFIEE